MFLDLCSSPRLPSLLITTLIYCCRISPTLSTLSFPFFPPLSLYLSLSSSPISQTNSPSRPGCSQHSRCPTFTLSYCFLFFFSSSDSCVSVCDAVCASGTTASSHLKHFRETHICCFRAQRDMPWQRLFEVASQGEPEPEQGIWETIKER